MAQRALAPGPVSEPEWRGPDQAVGVDASASLGAKVASGVRWGVIVSIASQVARIVFLVALMRLLGPHNFGIVGQAAIVVAVAQIFVHFGLAVSIVQRPRLDRSEIGSAFWLTAAMGVMLAISTVFAAPLVSSFFATEELTAILRVLSIAFVLKGLSIVPTALLTRAMRFRGLAIAEITSTLVSGFLGIVAAVLGAGYWALVVQTVSLEACYVLLVLCIGGVPQFAWSTSAAQRLWTFSSRVMGADVVNYVSDHSDKFFVARFLGPTSLALYSLAFRVLQLTLAVLSQAGRVVLPTFARLQDDRERLARVFLDVTESVALVLCPAMTLIMLVAPVAVPMVVGEAWADAVLPLQLIAAMTILYVLGAFMGPLTIAVGKADWEFRWSVVTMVVALVAFPVGLRWGIAGVALSYLIMLGVLNPVRFVIIRRLVPISPRQYVRALAPGSTCSAALGVVWVVTGVLLQGVTSGVVLTTTASLTAFAAYVLAVRVVWPTDFQRQLDLARRVLGRAGP